MRIKKINKIILEEPKSVYDITVPKYHNFLLEAGIFAHNCCQVIYSIFTNPLQTNMLDIAHSINKSSITTQNIKPAYYNVAKTPMSQREAMVKAMKMFQR